MRIEAPIVFKSWRETVDWSISGLVVSSTSPKRQYSKQQRLAFSAAIDAVSALRLHFLMIIGRYAVKILGQWNFNLLQQSNRMNDCPAARTTKCNGQHEATGGFDFDILHTASDKQTIMTSIIHSSELFACLRFHYLNCYVCGAVLK